MSGRWTLAGKKMSLIKTKTRRLNQRRGRMEHVRLYYLKARWRKTDKTAAHLHFGHRNNIILDCWFVQKTASLVKDTHTQKTPNTQETILGKKSSIILP